MKMQHLNKRLYLFVIIMLVILLSGCTKKSGGMLNDTVTPGTKNTEDIEADGSDIITIPPNNESNNTKSIPSEIEVDYSAYFGAVEGTAVFYDIKKETYYIYNSELAERRSSPCSSFKIISCLMGLESGAIGPEASTQQWDGMVYPVMEWNKDLNYKEAFQYSSIWYFREVIDQIGEEYIQNTLNTLDYGNKDISEWEGSLNNMIFPDIKDQKAINGFWQESSLQISPREQVDIVKRIFEDKDVFRQDNLDLVKEVMLVENDDSNIMIYGKTGSGIMDDTWNDAWFVGILEINGETIYFAVRLNQPGKRGADAKEIALNIMKEEFEHPSEQ